MQYLRYFGVATDHGRTVGQGATIRVSRPRGKWWFAFQPLSLELDGAIVGKLVGGDTLTIEVSPGEHVLRVKFRLVVWSDRLTLFVASGEERLVECRSDWAGYPSIR
jgi:hypothetical protein